MYLLNFSCKAQAALWDILDTAALDILPLDRTDVARMRELMRKYRDLPTARSIGETVDQGIAIKY